MKKSALKIRAIAILALLQIGLVLPTLKAQTYSDDSGQLLADGRRYTVPYQNRTYLDLKVPQLADGKYLYLRLEGADGGRFRASTYHSWFAGGEGTTVVLIVDVGNGVGELPVGSTLRFIVGEKGGERSTSGGYTLGAGSGGGTGLAYKGPGQNDKWQLLAVAGAGSGSIGNCCVDGIDGGPGGDIVATLPSSSTGVGGDAYQNPYMEKYRIAGGGGGAFSEGATMTQYSITGTTTMSGGSPGWPGGPDNGAPTGGNGGQNSGWGFGGGGSTINSSTDRTGGGGGYTGGRVPYPDETNENSSKLVHGDGGGSFYNATYAKIGYAIVHGTTTSPGDGFVEYQFVEGAIFNPILFTYNTNKCIDDYGSSTSNGNNIQTYTCTGNSNQQWFFHPSDRTIRSKVNPFKCVDLNQSNTNNGTNIQLYDCNGTDAQHWVYNGLYKTIHSSVNSDKCFDAKDADKAINSNVNLQLWDCLYSSKRQKWDIDGATSVTNLSNMKHIIPTIATSFAVHSHTGAESGSNIQLWTKDDTNTAEQWYFDGLAIKMRDHQDLCIDLNQSNTDNGNNIKLYTCNGSNAQKWIFDGMTKSVRSVVNPGKCMQIELNTDGAYGKRSNVDIQDCNGSAAQQFLIQE
ncbi:MAG: ricin-type beta-trefoil lectin domain protein [Lewinellaceae bacterium]|nr:ricin-type beta-trefoil lectin domain protein [Lewinellaceae bacterium]